MTEQTEVRKLAAVMFTDLEGYTSMFQKNETSALEKVRIHRQFLDEISAKHHGQIIQFYGDGSLVVYDSVIDAVRSAIELQGVSKDRQIPLRVGIHIGDVIFRDQDIFGDAVNVASRIQSVGVPGSIVISRKVADEIKNQPEISTLRLGQYSLKNVTDRLELFAITGSGLVTPPKQSSDQKKPKPILYLLIGGFAIVAYILLFNTELLKSNRSRLQEERIVIPPFEDLTSRPALSKIGEVARSIIIHDLNEYTDADVVSDATGLLYSNADMASMINNPALARQTGATNMVKGSYSLWGSAQDSLLFLASIIDTKNNKTPVITIPKIYCNANNPMDCIKEMSNSIRGYWKSKSDHVFRVPNYDAYVAFIKAQKIWASPDPKINKKAKEYLIQAIGYDSLFLDAYFLLLDGFSNENQFGNELDTIGLIRTRFKDLTPRQDNYLQYYEEEIYGRNIEVYKHFIKEYPYDPKDLFINTTGMVLAIESLNDPATALRFNQEIDVDSLDLKTCTYCRTRVNMAMLAYADLSDKINAGKLAERLKPYAEKPGQATRLIAHYMNVGDTASVNDVIRMAARDTTLYKDNEQFYCLMAARYAMLNRNNQLRDHYADRAIVLYGTTSNRTLGRCYYLKGDLDAAEKIFNAEIKLAPDNRNLYVDLGLVYARRGDTKKTNEIISKLDAMKEEYDLGQTPYFQGRLKAVLGEHDAAIEYLNTSLDEGATFKVGTTFQHDPDLMSLHQDERYLALLKRNRQM